MFSDMDHTLRELGVSDMSVGRRVKAMWEALNGRSQAYAAPLDAGDRAALAEAIGRNVWRGADPARVRPRRSPRSRSASTVTSPAQKLDDLLKGQVEFLPPATVPA